jgi:hypothetical protein
VRCDRCMHWGLLRLQELMMMMMTMAMVMMMLPSRRGELHALDVQSLWR